MPRIIAYTYAADVHCPYCARTDAVNGALLRRNPLAPPDVDEHGLAHDLIEREGNPIHPVFSTDEHEFTSCSDCGERI